MVRPFENNASYLFSISSLFRRNKREDLWPTNNNRWLEQIRPTYFPGLYWPFATGNLYLKYKEVVESAGIFCFRIQEKPYSFSMNISFSYLLARPILPLWKLTDAMPLDQIETRSGINRNNARWLKMGFGLASFFFSKKKPIKLAFFWVWTPKVGFHAHVEKTAVSQLQHPPIKHTKGRGGWVKK